MKKFILNLVFVLAIVNLYAQQRGKEAHLIKAAQNGETNVVQKLLNKGVNPDSRYTNGVTALMQASRYGQIEVVKLLLANGAHVNSETTVGATALHMAAYNGQTEIIKLLLDKGANPDLVDNKGKIALDYAKNDEIRNLLHHTSAAKTEKAILDLRDNETYDLHFLVDKGIVRAKGTGQSITQINAVVENLVSRTIRVVVTPGTYFVARAGSQNMVARRSYVFTLNPLATKRLNIDASCINAALAIPGENDNFYALGKTSDNLRRFLEACEHCDPMVVQAGVWAITDRYTGYQVKKHLIAHDNYGHRSRAISNEDVAEARRILRRLGIKTPL